MKQGGRDRSHEQLEMMKNFAHFLSKVDRLRNTLILSYHHESCRALLASGFLCFVDEAAPQPQDLPGSYAKKHPYWFSKYWHAHRLNQLNLTVLFLDNDAVILQDPFHFHDKGYDIEGLSDWNWLEDVPTPQEMALSPCLVYGMKTDPHVPGGQQLINGNHFKFWNRFKRSEHVNPCQSTGVWFSEPSPPALLFLDDFLDWLLNKRPNQWDQAAWNEAIMSHLIGTADRPGLRFRLLPVLHFNNMETYERRLGGGKPVDEVILHAGGVHGPKKRAVMERLGFWRADDWLPETGHALIREIQRQAGGSLGERPLSLKQKIGQQGDGGRWVESFLPHLIEHQILWASACSIALLIAIAAAWRGWGPASCCTSCCGMQGSRPSKTLQ